MCLQDESNGLFWKVDTKKAFPSLRSGNDGEERIGIASIANVNLLSKTPQCLMNSSPKPDCFLPKALYPVLMRKEETQVTLIDEPGLTNNEFHSLCG